MELNVPERIVLLDGLSTYKCTFLGMPLVRKLREELVFTEDENKEFGISVSSGQVKWTSNAAKDIPVGPKAQEIVAELLAKLEISEELEDKHYSLYEKFVEVKE